MVAGHVSEDALLIWSNIFSVPTMKTSIPTASTTGTIMKNGRLNYLEICNVVGQQSQRFTKGGLKHFMVASDVKHLFFERVSSLQKVSKATSRYWTSDRIF